MSRDRAAAGAFARRTGERGEPVVDGIMSALRHRGEIVSFRRNHPPWRQAGPARDGVLPVRLVGHGAPDWDVVTVGQLIRGDDKSVAGERFPLDAIPLHQAEAFDAWEKGGGVAVVLLELRPQHRAAERFVLPWRRLGPLWWSWHGQGVRRAAPGTASLSLSDLVEVGARFGSDWLKAWRAAA